MWSEHEQREREKQAEKNHKEFMSCLTIGMFFFLQGWMVWFYEIGIGTWLLIYITFVLAYERK